MRAMAVHLALIVMLAAASCSEPAVAALSEGEVEDFLHELTIAGASAPHDEICERFALSELDFCLETAGDASVRPAGVPEVECMAPSRTDAGWWVVVTGETSAGDTYHSRLHLVRDDDGRVVSQVPFYWHSVWTSPSGAGAAAGAETPQRRGGCAPE